VGQPTIYLRFHLHTDYSVTKDGWVMDDLLLMDGTTTLFSDGFESGTGAWVLDAPWGASGSSHDQARVQVSIDDTTWNDLVSYQGTLSSYTQVSINLSAYLGQPSIRFRWRLATDAIGEYDGWYVDDIVINISGSQAFSDGFESGTSNWILDSPWDTTLPSTVAYISGSRMSTVADDLTELRNRGAISDYDVFKESNINDLWAHLDQYRTILMEEDIVYKWSNPCNPSCDNPIPVTQIGLSIYNHRQQLGQWIYQGGGLFVTDQNDVSGSNEMYWAWLPDELLVKSKNTRNGHSATNLYVVYDPGLFSFPNIIDVTRVSSGEAHGEFTSFPGYTAMVRDRSNSPSDDVLEIYRYYGAGVVVLSHLEYETANYDCGSGRTCDANYVENELHFLRMSVSANAIYPNENGKLDVFATATSSALGELTPSNTQSATFDIRNASNVSTGITGTLGYDATKKRWQSLNTDVDSLVAGTYSALVTFVDQQGSSGSGTALFWKGLPSGDLGFSTPNARNGGTVLVYATLWDTQGGRITDSDQLTATLTGITTSFRLYDDGTHGDLHAQDGEYSAWQTVSGSGDLRAALYYQGNVLLDQASLTVINNPDLIVLTDIEDLYNEFIDTGTNFQEDHDNNHVMDFYDLLARLNRYAAAHRGIVYDLSHEITTANGYANDYATLVYGGGNNNTNRFQMGRLIDRTIEQVDQDTLQSGQHSIKAVALVGDDEVVPFHRRDDPIQTIDGSRGEWEYGTWYYEDYRRNVSPRNPTLIDSAANFIMTDVPYSTFSDADPANEDQPQPDIPVGRVFAEHPYRLIAMIDAYDTRIRLDDNASNASLFHLDPDNIDWPWFGDNVFVPILTPHFQAGNVNNAPPFGQDLYYHYNGNVVNWTPVSVTTSLPATDLTLLYSHANHQWNSTQSGTDLDAAHYPL